LCASAQHLTYNEWLQRAMVDRRLDPCYGAGPKTPAQMSSDAEFVAATLAVDSVRRSASGRLVDHGTALLKGGDLAQAMMRFNQAWLVDSTSARPFWGFGAFFMALDRPALALRWYKRGLELDGDNVPVLNGMTAALLAERHAASPEEAERRNDLLSAALALAQRAHDLDPTDATAVYRLAVCHLLRSDCPEAIRFSEQCAVLPSCPMEAGFRESLLKRCP